MPQKSLGNSHFRTTSNRFAAALLIALAAIPAALAAPTGSIQSNPELWPRLEPAIAPDPVLEQRIDELLARMSLEQKVGQMIQAEIQYVKPADVRKYHLGSILNGGGSFPGKDKYAEPADWLALAEAFYQASMDTSKGELAIPILWGTDAVHGHSNVYGATIFPHNIGLGAARNPALIRKIGAATAVEVLVTGIPWTFAPTLAVARDDRWGRTYEAYSEDPAIVHDYAGEMVAGLQGVPGEPDFLGDGKVLATAKHFLGDGGTENGQDQGNNLAAEQELVDIHAQGYLTALDMGVQTVMASFNSWHGVKMHGNRELLTTALKERMGFDGLLVGDWNGHGQIPGCSNSSCAQAINAGVDLFMAPEDWKALWRNTVKQVKRGEIPMARVDDAVRRILRVKMRLRMFERGAPSAWPYAGKAEYLGSAEHRALARQAVRESLVLLKNNSKLLPLNPGLTVGVAGQGADSIEMQTGGWTLSWQGTGNENSDFPGATSILGGIEQAVSAAGGKVVFDQAGDFAETPDVAIVVIGEAPYAEFQGDLRYLQYKPGDPREVEMLSRLRAQRIPVVTVFLSGRPLWINPYLNRSDAFVAAWLPGSEGAGIADVLFRTADGEANHDFKGRLSISWPRSPDQTVLNAGSEPYEPLFTYGYGLTYGDRVDLAADLPDSEQSGAGAAQADLEIFVKRMHEPWVLKSSGGDPVAESAGGGAFVTIRNFQDPGEGRPSATQRNRRVQNDAIQLRWQTGQPGVIGFMVSSGGGEEQAEIDASTYAKSGGVLQFEMMLESGDVANLRLGMLDAGGPGVEMRLGRYFEAEDPGQWKPFSFSLGCFASQGLDFGRLVSPFYLNSTAAVDLQISDVRLLPGPGVATNTSCDKEQDEH